MDNLDNYQLNDDYGGIVDESFEDVEQNNDMLSDLNDLNSVHGSKRRSVQPATPKLGTRLAPTSSKTPSASKSNTSQSRHLAFRIDRVCEYAECLMHCILFKINYYNKKTHFDKAVKYNIIVYVC
jgi:hypothetical protein